MRMNAAWDPFFDPNLFRAELKFVGTRCGQENPAEARFCNACGASLADSRGTAEERRLVSVLFVDLDRFSTLGTARPLVGFRHVAGLLTQEGYFGLGAILIGCR